MGQAILTVTDSYSLRHDLNIVWRQGFDIDASISIPPELREDWDEALQTVQQADHEEGWIAPFPTIAYSIHVSNLTRSATGFLAIAFRAFDDVRWRVAPPYPDVDPLGPGEIP